MNYETVPRDLKPEAHKVETDSRLNSMSFSLCDKEEFHLLVEQKSQFCQNSEIAFLHFCASMKLCIQPATYSPGAKLWKLLRLNFCCTPLNPPSPLWESYRCTTYKLYHICNQKVHLGHAKSWYLPKYKHFNMSTKCWSKMVKELWWSDASLQNYWNVKFMKNAYVSTFWNFELQ